MKPVRISDVIRVHMTRSILQYISPCQNQRFVGSSEAHSPANRSSLNQSNLQTHFQPNFVPTHIPSCVFTLPTRTLFVSMPNDPRGYNTERRRHVKFWRSLRSNKSLLFRQARRRDHDRHGRGGTAKEVQRFTEACSANVLHSLQWLLRKIYPPIDNISYTTTIHFHFQPSTASRLTINVPMLTASMAHMKPTRG